MLPSHLVQETVNPQTGIVGVSMAAAITGTVSDGFPLAQGEAAADMEGQLQAWVQPDPVSIALTLNGTTKDSSGNDNILVGQGCTAYIQASGPVDSSVTFSNFNWTIGGETFKSFERLITQASFPKPSLPYGRVNYLTATDLTGPIPHWYWKKGLDSGEPETVSCTATVNINGVASGTVTASKVVNVWQPYHEFQYHIDPNTSTAYASLGTEEALAEANIEFDGAVGVQQLFYSAYGNSGTWQFTQLWQFLEVFNPYPFTDVITDGYVLDAEFNYSSKDGSPWTADAVDHAITNPSWQTLHSSSDSPSATISTSSAVTINDYFKTYMMYQPPGADVSWVPLHKMERNWLATLAVFNNSWLPNIPGNQTVTFEGLSTEFPIWENYYPQQTPP